MVQLDRVAALQSQLGLCCRVVCLTLETAQVKERACIATLARKGNLVGTFFWTIMEIEEWSGVWEIEERNRSKFRNENEQEREQNKKKNAKENAKNKSTF